MFVLQAWAFTMGVRLVLNKVPFMNMENFEKSIWVLHRKLFHRFLKYIKYFRKATTELPEYQQAIQDEIHAKEKEMLAKEKKKEEELEPQPINHIISLLTSSSDEVSEDEVSEGESSPQEEEVSQEE